MTRQPTADRYTARYDCLLSSVSVVVVAWSDSDKLAIVFVIVKLF